MAVYPFYVSADADGRKSPIAGGTRKRDGSITTTIYQRDNGAITEPYKIRQFTLSEEDGVRKLCTQVIYLGNVISEHVTDY